MPPALLNKIRATPLAAIAWLSALVLSGVLFASDLFNALSHDSMVAGGTIFGRDFVNVFSGGRLVLEDRLGEIYNHASYSALQTALFEGRVEGHYYSYPPVSFLYIWLFALPPYGWSYLLWTCLTGAAFALAAKPYLREENLPFWLALLMPAAAVNIWAGHYGFLMGALWLGCWRLLDSRPRTAGVLLGLMVVKPHLAILMPLVLARRRAWIAFLYAGLTSASLIALSALIFGTGPWVAFLTNTLGFQASLVEETSQFFATMMPTVVPNMLLAGLPVEFAWFLQVAFASAAIAALLLMMPADPARASFAVACATFLVLPYAFNYDLMVVNLAAMILMYRLRPDDSSYRRAILVCAFLLPLLMFFLGRMGLPLAPFLIFYLLMRTLEPSRPALAPRDESRWRWRITFYRRKSVMAARDHKATARDQKV